ncbi:1-deoxy-D-xylulose-5-phosphate reductoisomerase [candidate division WOR-3 bacterium]|nr:1-deoxy-D-xylulose-5-phosphate reductoisomerase [candidate division WOR-3 bacterium]
MKRIIILGSTGSIGRKTIEVIRHLGTYKVVGLAAYANYRRLAAQAVEFRPKIVTMISQKAYDEFKRTNGRARLLAGEEGIAEMVDALDADTIICAMASSIGTRGVIRAIEKRMQVCLATKEILVNFGDLIMRKAKQRHVRIIPIDSEHSAVYQCLENRHRKDLQSIILTASGGPFLNRSLKNVKKADVLNHPVWKMGRKITVDSATMMNKGLEVIEAHHLFGLPARMIKIVVHPEAICHSLVQFTDGTLLAQLSTPDMRLPIQYALTAPVRIVSPVPQLDITKVKRLTFAPPDYKKFACLELAYRALDTGKTMPAVLNTANEEAVHLFLNDQIGFGAIPRIIEKVMTRHKPVDGDLECYLEATRWAREQTRSLTC